MTSKEEDIKGVQHLYFLKALDGLSMKAKSEVILHVMSYPEDLRDIILAGLPDMPEPVRGETLRVIIADIVNPAQSNPFLSGMGSGFITPLESTQNDGFIFLAMPRYPSKGLGDNIHLGGDTRAIFADRLSKPVEDLTEDAGKQLAAQLNILFPPGLTLKYEIPLPRMEKLYDMRTDFHSVRARPTSVSTPTGASPLDMMETFLRSQDVLAPEWGDHKKSARGHWKEHLYVSPRQTPNDQPDDLD